MPVDVPTKLLPFHLYEYQVPLTLARNSSVPVPSSLSMRAPASLIPVLTGDEKPLEPPHETFQVPSYQTRSLLPSPLRSYWALGAVSLPRLLTSVVADPMPACP